MPGSIRNDIPPVELFFEKEVVQSADYPAVTDTFDL